MPKKFYKIDPGWKCLTVIHTQAYNAALQITRVKSFIVQALHVETIDIEMHRHLIK